MERILEKLTRRTKVNGEDRKKYDLRSLPSQPPGELNILRLDSDSLGVNSCQVGAE